MKCPRCGTENPVPEAHGHRCYNCGFVLMGEVARQDIHATARRRFYLQFGFFLIILVGLAIFAWTRNWFGLVSEPVFTPSEQPELRQLIGSGSETVTSNGASYLLSRDATWEASGIVFASQQYDDRLAPIAPIDILLVWGDDASMNREKLAVSLEDRSVTIKVNDLKVDVPSLMRSSAVLHLSSDPRTLRSLLDLRVGSKVTIGGYIVSTSIDGERVAGITTGTSGVPNAYLLYVTSLVADGKTIVAPS